MNTVKHLKQNTPHIRNTLAADQKFYYINHLAYGKLKPRKWNIFWLLLKVQVVEIVQI